MKALSIFAGLMALGLCLGVYWSTHAADALNGLRPAGPFTHEQEAAFIRSRVDWPIVPPEWVSGVELNELVWIKYEMLARCVISMSASVAIILLLRPKLFPKKSNPQSRTSGYRQCGSSSP